MRLMNPMKLTTRMMRTDVDLQHGNDGDGAISTVPFLGIAMPRLRLATTALLTLSLAACASTPRQIACSGGALLRVHDSLYFGTATPTGVVTPAQWTEFLGSTVTPRFPQGLTAWQASGQWRGVDGAIVNEASHVLDLIHPDDAASETAVHEIIAAYKSRFQQEAVLRVKAQACASF